MLVSVFLLLAVESNLSVTIRNTVEQEMLSRMEGDIHYLEDLIGDDDWSARNGALYCGDTLIGDGTEENAYLAPFLKMEENTGSFSFTFIRCPDDHLSWEGDKANGYQQGHYLRVSGSTLGPDGRKILGTYMDKKVADILDEEGVYSGSANVVGRQVFCLYRTLTDSENQVVGVIVVGRSIEEITASTRRAAYAILWFVVLLVIGADLVFSSFISRWISKLDTANHYLLDISTGTFPEEPLNLHTKDELAVTAQCINEMTEALKEKARISGELEAAANIQMYMLPRTFPPFPERGEFDVFASMIPAREVGGDYYDFYLIDDDHLAVAIADVAGKGVPAALFMAMSKMMMKNHAQMGMEPADVFTKVNRLLCEGNETNLFVTAWLGVLNLKTGRLTYVNAGHNPPFIRLKNGDFVPLRSDPAMVLAAFDTVRYSQNELMMSPGDRLFLYTDGVTEAMDENGSLYGTERLEAYLNSRQKKNATEVLNGLKADIDRFAGMREQADDITMLMLDYYGTSASENGWEKTFPASVSSLSDVEAFLENAFRNVSFPKETASRVQMAVEEIFVNIADYAYPDGEGTVSIRAHADADTVVLRFTDSGIPFQPLESADPDTTLPAEEREIGGLGLYLVKQMMDEIRYERKDGQNILTLSKNINQRQKDREV